MIPYALVNWIYKKLMKIHDIIVIAWRKKHHSWKALYFIFVIIFGLAAIGLFIVCATEVYTQVVQFLAQSKEMRRMRRIQDLRADERERQAQEKLDRLRRRHVLHREDRND